MIVYPLEPPSTPAPSAIEFTATNIVAVARSPFTAEEQIQAWPGEYLSLSVTLPPMKRAAAEQWIAFLLALRGISGTFLFGDASNRALLGEGGGTPSVLGAHSQGTKTLTTAGWPIDTTVLKAGDYFQLQQGSNTRLYKNLTDAVTDGIGVVVLDIFPRLRLDIEDGEPLVLSNPRGLFRLADNERKWAVSAAQIYGIQFNAIESLTSGSETGS